MTGFMTREEAEHYAALPTDARLIYGLDRQRQYLARHWLVPQPCPNCLKPLALVDAIHVDDPETNDRFDCVHCGAKLRHIVPLVAIAGVIWTWDLEPNQIPVKSAS